MKINQEEMINKSRSNKILIIDFIYLIIYYLNLRIDYVFSLKEIIYILSSQLQKVIIKNKNQFLNIFFEF